MIERIIVPAFTTVTPYYRDININFKSEMNNINYAVVAICDSINVSRTTTVWIDYQLTEKTISNCKIRFWNEKQADIASTEWNVIIFPYI